MLWNYGFKICQVTWLRLQMITLEHCTFPSHIYNNNAQKPVKGTVMMVIRGWLDIKALFPEQGHLSYDYDIKHDQFGSTLILKYIMMLLPLPSIPHHNVSARSKLWHLLPKSVDQIYALCYFTKMAFFRWHLKQKTCVCTLIHYRHIAGGLTIYLTKIKHRVKSNKAQIYDWI